MTATMAVALFDYKYDYVDNIQIKLKPQIFY